MRRLLQRSLGALLAAALALAGLQAESALERVTAQALAVAREHSRVRRMTWGEARRLAVEDAELSEQQAAQLAHLVVADDTPADEDLRAYIKRHHPQLLRDSLAYWMRYGAGMEVGPHHVEWSELLSEHTHLALLAARGHGKSAFWSYAYPLWRSWKAPNSLGLLISQTEGQVASLMRIIKDGKAFVDEDNREWRMQPAAGLPILAAIIPRSWQTTWTTERIWFTNGSTFIAKTFGKSFRGSHVQWIVVDDPIKENSQYSDLERAKSKAFLHRTIAKMLLPARDAQMACIGTPMHGDDLHADLERLHREADRRGRKRGDWFHKKFPGHWIDASGEHHYLWPQLRGPDWHRREKTANSLAYTQEIELRPVSDETSLFPFDLFTRRPETLDSTCTLRPSRGDIAAAGWSVYIGVDVAISAEVGADYTVIVCVGVDANANRHLIDLIRFKGQTFDAQLQAIIDANTRYGPELIFIEANQMQVLFASQLREKTDLPVRPFVTGEEKHSLRRGVPSLRPLIENGKWRFPRGDEYSVTATDALLKELNDFGFVKGKVQGIGNHDDCVMALWIVDQAVRAGGAWGFLGETEDDETRARELQAEALAAESDTADGAALQLEAMVVADREAEVERQRDERDAVAPRLNPHAVTWRHAATIHPDGVEGVRAAVAGLPADRAEHVRAWNALAGELPNILACDQAFAELVQVLGLDLTRSILRDLVEV